MSRLVVLAAPSGVGKTTIARALLARRQDLGFSVSATTRAPRAGEREGVDYFFLSREDFQRHIDDGAFVEWADYAGQRYGTLRREVQRIWDAGRAVLLDIEVQGTAQVREKYPPPESLAIFLLPPSGQELVNRIRGRGSESHAARWLPRLERACVELEDAGLFDQVVVNDNLEQAVADVSAAIDGRRAGGMRPEDRQRVARLIDELRTLLAELKRTETRGMI